MRSFVFSALGMPSMVLDFAMSCRCQVADGTLQPGGVMRLSILHMVSNASTVRLLARRVKLMSPTGQALPQRDAVFFARAAARMCAGVRPQQPPTILTPEAIQSRQNASKRSGEITSTKRQSGISK